MGGEVSEVGAVEVEAWRWEGGGVGLRWREEEDGRWRCLVRAGGDGWWWWWWWWVIGDEVVDM